jgi:hypothetical protein
MKGATSTENCQQSRSFCIWWGRVGGSDRFRHWVLADSIDNAVRRSRSDVSKALGPNVSLWKIEEPEDKIARAIPTDVVCWCEGPRRSSQRAGVIAFVLLWIGLLSLFHWKSRAVTSAKSMQSVAASGMITPEIRPESDPTMWSWDGFVDSTKDP